MVFWGTLKNRLLAGLAASNRLAHQCGLPKAFRGGPIRADDHLQAGGVKAATLLDPRIVSLPAPLIYFQGDPNILSPEIQGDVTEVRFGEVALWEYRDARVLPGAQGGLHGVSGDDRVIPGLNHSCLDENLFFETRFREPPGSDFIECGFLLDGGPGANFYHWMIDILPALGLARNALGKNMKFILNPYSKTREAQWEELGIRAESRVVSRGPLRVGKLYALGGLHNSIYGVFRPEPCLDFWRGYSEPHKRNKRLFVSRKDTTKRSLVNENELLSKLQPLSFEKVILDGMSLKSQATLFSGATHVVGMHGAGFANLIHSEAGTRLIEIFPPGYAHCFYQYICWIKNSMYFPVFSKAPSGGGTGDFNSRPGILDECGIREIVSRVESSS